MNRLIVGITAAVAAFLLMGCVDPDRSDTDEKPADDAGVDAPSLRAGGAPCDVDTQCESNMCTPSANDYSAGYCYAPTMEGCIEVTAPSPHKALCVSEVRTLYVCGDSWEVGLLGDCDDVATGDKGEKYHCCVKPGLP